MRKKVKTGFDNSRECDIFLVLVAVQQKPGGQKSPLQKVKNMAHEIRTEDRQQGRRMGWHGLTEVIKNLSLSSENLWLRLWDVEPVEIVARRGDGSILLPAGETWQALVTEKELKGASPLFVSSPFNRDTYSPLTNAEFLRVIGESLAAAGLPDDVESCGSVFNRRRVFVSIPLPGAGEFVAGERQFKGFLNFFNSFDKSCEFMANYSNICTVCNNTFNANLDVGGCFIPHTKNMQARLDGLPDVIARAVGMQEEFRNDFLKLAGRECTLAEARLLFVAFLSPDKAVSISTRTFNQAEELASLFIRGAGNKAENLADVFSAGTDLYTHSSAGTDKEKQFLSSEFGAGALAKRQLLGFLLGVADNRAEFNAECDRAEGLLRAYHDGVKVKAAAKAAAKAGLLPDAPAGTVSVVSSVPSDAAPVTDAPAPAATPAPAKGKGKGKRK